MYHGTTMRRNAQPLRQPPASSMRHLSSWPLPCNHLREVPPGKSESPCHIIEAKGLTAVSHTSLEDRPVIAWLDLHPCFVRIILILDTESFNGTPWNR